MEKTKYEQKELHDIATSILLKYRYELAFRRDKELHFDIYILKTETHSYRVYIGEESIMLVAYENEPFKQVFSLGVSTRLTVEEVNSVFDTFEAFIRKTLLGV